MSTERTTFEFGGKMALLVGMAVLLTTFGALGVLSAFHGERDFLVASLCFSVLFMLIFGLVILSRSDVVLTDQGIARQLWGWTWKVLGWESIEKIVEFPVSKGSGKYVWALNIFPTIKPRLRFTSSGKMFFTLDMNDSPELIECLNRYINAHDIGLIVRDTPLGKPRTSTRLSV